MHNIVPKWLEKYYLNSGYSQHETTILTLFAKLIQNKERYSDFGSRYLYKPGEDLLESSPVEDSPGRQEAGHETAVRTCSPEAN